MESRLTVYGDAVIDETKVKVWMKIGMFGQTSCKTIVYLLPECINGIDIMSDLETKAEAYVCSLDSIVQTC